MPDVGVLNLTIKDNSSAAAGGLNEFAGALRAVKDACKSGLNLSNGKMSVAQQIQTLANTVRSESTVIKNLGTLFNAISNFSKLKDIQINTQPIMDLKNALEGGMNIGKAGTEINKLREALTGDWGNEEKIGIITTSMNNIASAASNMESANAAGTIKSVAKSIEAYVSAIGSVSGGGAHDYLQQQIFSATSSGANSTGSNLAGGVKEGIDSQKEQVIASSVQMVQDAISAMKSALGIHSPSAVAESEIGVPTVQGVVVGLEKTSSEVQTAAARVAEDMISAMRSKVESSTIDFTNIPATGLNGTFKNAGEEIKYIINLIDLGKQAIQDWDNTYTKTQRQIKYNGLTDERSNMLKTSEEGFYSSLEKVEQYENILANIYEYIEKYTAETQRATQATEEQAVSLKNVESVKQEIASIKPLYENPEVGPRLSGLLGTQAQAQAILQIYKVTGIAIEEIMRQITELSHGTVTFGNAMKNSASSIQSGYTNTSTSIQSENEKIAESAEHAERKVESLKSSASSSTGTKDDLAKQFINDYSHADYLENKIKEMTRELSAKRSIGLIDKDEVDKMVMKIRRLQEELRRFREEQDNTSSSTFSLKGAFKDLEGAFGRMFPTLTQLYKSFIRMSKMRAIRYVIREIAKGFKEGVQNVYEYSKAIGSTFHESMDSAASSLAQMKNAIGAQVAPVLQSLIPILQNVVNWFINILNVVNQFFSLLNGQATWTRALPQAAEAFKDQTKSAKGAHNAMKDLLADWDELNIIQSQNSGGSGSSSSKTTADYASMFEEVDEYSQQVKDVVGWIQDHMELIKGIVKGIAVGILAWKVSKAFNGTLATLGTILAGVALVITGIEFGSAAGASAGSKGYFDTSDTLTAIGGAIAAGLGGALIGFKVGGIYGAGIGFVIGFGISAFATLTSFAVENHAREIRMKWGSSNYSPEALKAWAEEQFTFDISARISKLDFITETAEDERGKLEEKISDFIRSLHLAKATVGLDIPADEKQTIMQDLLTSANAVIGEYNAWLDKHQEMVSASLQVIPVIGDNGQDMSTELIEQLKVGSKTLKQYMTDLGKDIADAYNQGVKAEWGKGTEEAYLAQIERLNNIVARQNKYKREKKLENEQVMISSMSYDDFGTAMEDINQFKQDYIDSVTSTYNELYENELEIAGSAQGMLDDLEARKGEVSEEYYTDTKAALEKVKDDSEKEQLRYKEILHDVAGWLEGMSDGIYNDPEYKKSMDQLRETLIQTLRRTEGYDFFDTDVNFDEASINKDWKYGQESVRELYYAGDRVAALSKLIDTLDSLEYTSSEYATKAMEEYGLTKYSVMSDEQVSEFLKWMRESFDAEFVRMFIRSSAISDEDKERWYRFMPRTESELPTDELIRQGIVLNSGIGMLNGARAATDMLNDERFYSIANNTDAMQEEMKRIQEDVGTLVKDDDFDYVKKEIDRMEEESKATSGAWEYYDKIREMFGSNPNASMPFHLSEQINSLLNWGNESAMRQIYEDLLRHDITDYDYWDEYDYIPNFGMADLARVDGGTGTIDVGWTPKTYGDIESSSDMSGAVASGVRDGNEEQNLKLDEVITWLSRLYAKNISVNFTPTSAAGAWVVGSQAVFNKVTG